MAIDLWCSQPSRPVAGNVVRWRVRRNGLSAHACSRYGRFDMLATDIDNDEQR